MNTNTAEEQHLQHEQPANEQQDEDNMEDDSDDNDDNTGTGMYSCANCRDYGSYGFECLICGEDSCCYYMGEELTEDEIGDRVWAMRDDDIAWTQEMMNDSEEGNSNEDAN